MDFAWIKVGIAEIDEQHADLFLSIKLLVRALNNEDALEEVGQVVEFLGTYTRNHFGAEERLMRQHGYPQIEAHLAEHDLFVKRLSSVTARCDAGEAQDTIADDVCAHLGEWLVSHIARHDKKLSMFLTPVLSSEQPTS